MSAPRPLTLRDPQYAPGTWEPTRRSAHRTDAHRQAVYGRLEPSPGLRPWWRLW